MMGRRLARPVVWLVFAAMVGVPSAQLTRFLRAQYTSSATAEPTPAAEPPSVVADTGGETGDRGQFVYEPVGPSRAQIVTAAFGASGRLVAILDDSGNVAVWDVKARKHLRDIATGLRRPIGSGSIDRGGVPIAIAEPYNNPDWAHVAVGGSDGVLRSWGVVNGLPGVIARHSELDAPSGGNAAAPLVDVEAPNVGGQASVSQNGSVALWAGADPANQTPVWLSRTPRGRVRDVEFSPDGSALAVAGDDGLYLVTFRQSHQHTWTLLDGSLGSPLAVQFSRGGGLLAAVWSDGKVHIYSALTRERVRTVTSGPRGRRKTLAFSRNDDLLAVSDGQRVIHVVHMNGVSAPMALTAPRGPVSAMWFTPDAKSLVVASSGDRFLRQLPIPDAQ